MAELKKAVDAGASGVDVSAWSTSDGVAVVHHSGFAGGTFRRRRIDRSAWSDLPGDVAGMAELYDACGPDTTAVVDAADDRAAAAVVRAAEDVGVPATARLWLVHPDLEQLATWRARWPDVNLVNLTSHRAMRRGPERRAAELAATRVQAVALPPGEWSGGLTTLFHRFGCYAFAFDVQFERVVRELLRMGIDAVSSVHPDRMLAAREPRADPDPRP